MTAPLVIFTGAVRITIDLDHFTRRLVQDAFRDAVPGSWRRRARDFEEARPRRDDFNGNADHAELADRDRRLANLAENCRRHADLLVDW